MNDTIMPPRPEDSFGIMNTEMTPIDQPAVIIPMEAASVQRIVAGQAITDLASAVKELVDNALDAGAKVINIRLFNQGLDIVEVSDDGSGVPVESRPYMAMKHATSKIRQFDDIYETDSLGFRGEALFCLANISNKMVVATRTADQPLGQKLEFTREGYLRHDTVCPVPRKVGTTVAVVKLFDALPVRRADLVKRIQAQRREVFLMVQGYAIHCLETKFNLFDISDTGREELRLSTMQGAKTLDQTISSVLGSRFLAGMSQMSIDLPVDDKAMWRVEGLVSKAPNMTARDGSVARNAQFFAINGRPVDLPRISKTLSEAWRTFEGATKKKPACVLHFSLPKNSFDINLAPSKRQVLLAEEKRICAMVLEGALSFWSSQRDGKFFQNELDSSKGIEAAGFDIDPATTPKGRRVKRRLAFVNDFRTVKLQHDTESNQLQGVSKREDHSRHTPPPPSAVTPSQKEDRVHPVSSDANSTDANSMDGASPPPCDEQEQPIAPVALRIDKTSDAERRRFAAVQEKFRQRYQQDDVQALDTNPITPYDEERDHVSAVQQNDDATPSEKGVSIESNSAGQVESVKVTSQETTDSADEEPPKKKVVNLQDFGFTPMEKVVGGKSSDRNSTTPRTAVISASQVRVSSSRAAASTKCSVAVRKVSSEDESRRRKRRATEECDADEEPEEDDKEEEEAEAVQWDAFQGTVSVVEASLKARLELQDRRKRLKLVKAERDKITLSSQKSDDDEMVEEVGDDGGDRETIVSLTKKDFEGMEVIGQFNLGFILAKCRNNNLWVLDQHACDEKYNFERLCATTVIHEQKLLAPMPLELSPSEESCVLENMEIFEQNGFRFEYKPDAAPRHRLALIALPHSGARDGRKAVQFGKDDVSALCAVLGADGSSEFSQDHGGTGVDGNGMYGNNAVRRYAGLSQNGEKVMTRLPKAVAMFANRACRGSVMIGTALSKKEMETIVQRLASVQHPWNCPHGRPTLKHVKDMLPIEAKDERRTIEHTAGPTVVAATDMTQAEE